MEPGLRDREAVFSFWGYDPDPGHEFRVIFLVRRQGLP
jgi:hypothetical protein